MVAVEPNSVAQSFTLGADRDHTFNALLLAIKDNWSIEAADANAGTLRFSNNKFGKRQHDFTVKVSCSSAPCEYSVESQTISPKAKSSGSVSVMNDLHSRAGRFLKTALDALVVKKESRQFVSSLEPAEPAAGPPATASIKSSPEKIKVELLRRFAKNGYEVLGDSSYSISFLRDQAVTPGILQAILFGDAAPTRYQLKASFTLVPEQDGSTTVNTSAWGLIATNVGRPSEYQLTTAPAIRNDLQQVLNEVKESLEAELAVR
jgi:hypothetical protein